MSVVEFKGTGLSVITTVLKTADVSQLRQALHDKLSRTPDFFMHEPIVLDLRDFHYVPPVPWLEIIALLKSYQLVPIACQHVPESLVDSILPYLPILQKDDVLDLKEFSARTMLVNKTENTSQPSVVIDKPLRSGQKIYAEKADLIVLAMVSHGAEIISDYNIHVYAPLRGRALAGASGDTQSRIFTTSFYAELIAIAGIYSTFEKGLPKQFCHKPVKISLQRVDGERDTLLLEDLQSS